jgi:hypothetical protein
MALKGVSPPLIPVGQSPTPQGDEKGRSPFKKLLDIFHLSEQFKILINSFL